MCIKYFDIFVRNWYYSNDNNDNNDMNIFYIGDYVLCSICRTIVVQILIYVTCTYDNYLEKYNS